MNQVGVIMRAKLLMAGHAIASVRHESKLKVGVISVSVVALWLGALLLFLEGIGWLTRFGGGIGSIILARMLGVLGMVVFFMLIFSNVLVSFSTLYRSREVNYLVQAPMSFRSFFLARFVECVAFSSWAFAFIGSPVIIAFGVTNDAPPGFYLASLLYFLPFVVIPSALGAMVTLVLARIFPRLKMRTMALLGCLVILLFFVYWQQSFDAAQISEDSLLPAILDVTAQTQSALLPSHWAARGMLAASDGEYRETVFSFGLLASNALMVLWLAANLAGKIFYTGWSGLAGQDRTRIRLPGRGILGRLDKFLAYVPNPVRALVVKDVKLFWRDPAQWSQFVIFFGIMALYIANLRNARGQLQQEFWRSWIACLNIGACTLILATLTSRFVFPLVSLEGRRFWILGLAPLSFRRLVWQKFWLSVVTTSVFTVGLAVLSAHILRLELVYFALSVYSVLITNFGLAGLAVGLGTLFPNFQEDNPARIVSGMGGTLNFILSVGYIGFVVGAQTLILQWRVLNLFRSEQSFYVALACVVVFVTALSAVSTILPMRLGLKNLRLMEF